MSDHVRPRVRWNTSEFARAFGLSRQTAIRIAKSHGWGRWIYANQIRRHEPDLWESYVLVVIASQRS